MSLSIGERNRERVQEKKEVADATEPNLADFPNAIESSPGRERVREILSNRFASLALLSDRGGVAIYQGRDLSRDSEPVCVKVLHDCIDDSGELELFRLEGLAASKLVHRNILRSSAPEVTEGVHFSVSERRADAESLGSLLTRKAWLDLELAAGIAQQIGCALEYAHAQNILHLRIHPDNVFIDPDGTVFLGDFGLEARDDLAWAHRQRSDRCPVHYISPEQVNGEALDFRSDLYSLGIVLYQALTDRMPIDSDDHNLVKEKHVFQSPLAPHLYCSDIPVSLSNVILRLLEKDPNARFQDVASFQTEMESSIRQASVNGSEIFARKSLESERGDGNDPIDVEQFSLDSLVGPLESQTTIVREEPFDESSGLNIAIHAAHEREPSSTQADNVEKAKLDSNVPQVKPATEDTTLQWGQAILRILLALAAIGGLIVLANGDLPKSPASTSDEVISVQGSERDADPAAPPQSGDANPAEQAPDTAEQNASSDASGAATSAPPARLPVRPRPAFNSRTSASLRSHRWKRRWVRAGPYWRQSRDPRRKY
jgi:serine/threonine protein kinase